MTIDLSTPLAHWILVGLVLIGLVVVIRFLWQHILRFLVHIVLSLLGIIALLAFLHFVIHLF
jgi:predicted exporter